MTVSTLSHLVNRPELTGRENRLYSRKKGSARNCPLGADCHSELRLAVNEARFLHRRRRKTSCAYPAVCGGSWPHCCWVVGHGVRCRGLTGGIRPVPGRQGWLIPGASSPTRRRRPLLALGSACRQQWQPTGWGWWGQWGQLPEPPPPRLVRAQPFAVISNGFVCPALLSDFTSITHNAPGFGLYSRCRKRLRVVSSCPPCTAT